MHLLMIRSSLVLTLLLHEIFPSGPWVSVAFIGVGVLFVTPLCLIRRKYGGRWLVVATAAEVVVGAVLASAPGILGPAAVGGAATALILHLRALRRPDGYAIVDIGLAIAGFWVALVMFAIVAYVVLD